MTKDIAVPRPKVSIISISYNQSKYIEEALKSFLSQKTDFQIEIIIADDASTDGTQSIIQKYSKSHPDIIKPILRNKNIGAWNNFTDAIRSAKGDYIALCEGDDYWTDSVKLQKQIDFLESHNEYALCFHPVKVLFEDKKSKSYVFPELREETSFTINKLLEGNYIQTNSVVYRRQNYDHLAKDMMPGDWYLHVYHSQFGKIGFINEVMSIYRRHSKGIWWAPAEERAKFLRKSCDSHMKLFLEFKSMFSGHEDKLDIITESAASLLQETLTLNNDPKYIEETAIKYPKFTAAFIHTLISQDLRNQEIASDRLEEIHRLNRDLEHSQIMRIRSEDEAASLRSSKPYKIGSAAIKPLRVARSLRRHQ